MGDLLSQNQRIALGLVPEPRQLPSTKLRYIPLDHRGFGWNGAIVRVSSAEAIASRSDALLARLAASIETAIDALSASAWKSLSAIVVVALLSFLPGFFTLPPVDRDEPRFAQSSHQMVESGNYFDIRLQDEARYKKPIGIYWLQSAAVFLTGTGPDAPIWVYRLPSLVGAIVAACLTWWLTIAFGRPRVALMAGAILATIVLLNIEARLAKTDAVLLATILLAHGALARAWLAQRTDRDWWLAFLFWTALGASILIKGPVGPAAIACPLILLSIIGGSFGWLKRLAPLPGMIWMLVMVAPWFVAIGISSRGAFFGEALGRDLMDKVGSAQETHGAPPGAYAVAFLFTFWPAAAYFTAGMSWILDRVKQPAILYGLVAVLPFWLAVEAIPTKLPHYVLPLYPFFAIATALVLDQGGVAKTGWFSRFARSGAWLLPAFLIVVAVILVVLLQQPPSVPGLLCLLVAVAIGIASHRLWIRSPIASAAFAMVAAILTFWGLLGAALPGLPQARISERLVAAGDAAAACANPLMASAGYGEPSLVLLAGTHTLLTDGEQAANFLGQGGCRVAFVDPGQYQPFKSRADDLGLNLREAGPVSGYNINGGRFVTIRVFTLPGATR